jgi:hypothetical protein
MSNIEGEVYRANTTFQMLEIFTLITQGKYVHISKHTKFNEAVNMTNKFKPMQNVTFIGG